MEEIKKFLNIDEKKEKAGKEKGKIAISTTLSREIYDKIKAKGLHFNELILLGLNARDKNPAILERLAILETGNDKLQRKLKEFYQKLCELKEAKK